MQTKSKSIVVWLSLCFVIIGLHIFLDGISRLKESGFSIANWKKVEHFISASNEDEFDKIFQEYKTMPQFSKAFPDMELPEFKSIYVIEYAKYIINVIEFFIFFIPFVIFCVLRKFTIRQILQLTFVFAIGLLKYPLQDYFLSNNLIENVNFAPYRLSQTVALNYIFFALILWQILSFSYPKSEIGGFELEKPSLFLKIFACITVGLIFLQIVEGGAVSGLNAGLSYNTFPKMDGKWVPDEILLQPIEVSYENIFEDVATAQFFHRFIASITVIALILFWILGHNSPHVAHLLPILFSIVVVEFLLGVLTLLFAVPITLTSLHQANVLLVFAISVTIMHRLFIPKKTIAYDIGYEESK